MSAAFRAVLIITICSLTWIAAGEATAESRMADIHDVAFSCRPARVANRLEFSYVLENKSGADIYALDQYPAVDPATRTAFADVNGVYISWLPPNGVYFLKGIPPLPTHPVAVRIIPLGTKVLPGGRLERTVSIPLPLVEQSPYYGDLPVRQHDQVEVAEVVFAVQFLRSTVEGFAAGPVDYADGAYRVQGRNTVGQAETVECRFPTKSLTLLTRQDAFTRATPP